MLSRYDRLREDPAVDSWLTNVAAPRGRSNNTETLYLSSLDRFCRFTKKTPGELIADIEDSETRKEEKNAKQRTRLLVAKFIESLRDRGLSPMTIKSHVAAVRSFYSHSGIAFPALRVAGKVQAPSRPLTPEELKKIMEIADVRDRALCSILAFAGPRISSIAKLQVKHVHLDEEPPAAIECWDDKKNTWYLSFLHEKGVEAIKDYLHAREIGTNKIPPEQIGPGSPLITNTHGIPMRGKAVYRRVKNLFKLAGIDGSNGRVTGHSFRKFNATQLNRGGLPPEQVNALQGRVPIQGAGNSYIKFSVEQLREGYAEASKKFFIRPEFEEEFERTTERVRELEEALRQKDRELRAQTKSGSTQTVNGSKDTQDRDISTTASQRRRI